MSNDDSEREHKLMTDRSQTGGTSFGDDAEVTGWRDARDGGSSSYELKVRRAEANAVRLSTWGRDSGRRTFDVVVNGRKLKTISITDTGKDEFVDHEVPLPADVTEKADRVRVVFQAHKGETAGGIFDVRTLADAITK